VSEQNKRLMIATTAEVLATLFPPEEATPPVNNIAEREEPPARG
jgi:hypothetical protein